MGAPAAAVSGIRGSPSTETVRILFDPSLAEAGSSPTEIKRSTRMAPDAPANSDYRE